MSRATVISRGALAASVALVAAFGCERPNPYKLTGDTTAHENCPPITPDPNDVDPAGGQGAADPSGGAGAGLPDAAELDKRVVDYGEALRSASLKLVGNIPTLNEVYELDDVSEDEKPAKYEEIVDRWLSSPDFALAMIGYWRNVFKMYGDGVMIDGLPAPSRETAPTFAAMVSVDETRAWTELLTATTGTCPTYDANTNTFTPADCANGTATAGVLTDPGIHSLYWGNLAFRRNRFFHEAFLCRNANASGGAEPVSDPSTVGGCSGETAPANYTSPWAMSSIAGDCNGGQVEFHEYNTTIVCANCHSTWNHRAPLFANFDKYGQYMATPQVLVPVEGSPFAVMGDWLPPGEMTAWKFDVPAANLTELGNVMVADEEVIDCAVKRIWNYAMARGDIVINETPVPATVIAEYVTFFRDNNFSIRKTLKHILLSEDFVSF